jgi:hypothetical protein
MVVPRVSHQCTESVRLLATEPGLEQELKEVYEKHPDAEALLRTYPGWATTEFPKHSPATALRAGGGRRAAANRGEPSDGLEPSTPSLPCGPGGNW